MSLSSTCFGSSAWRPFNISSNGVKDEQLKRSKQITFCKSSCPEFMLIFFCASVLMLALLLLLARLHFTSVHSNAEPKCCDVLAVQNIQWLLQTFISWKQSTGTSQAYHLQFTHQLIVYNCSIFNYILKFLKYLNRISICFYHFSCICIRASYINTYIYIISICTIPIQETLNISQPNGNGALQPRRWPWVESVKSRYPLVNSHSWLEYPQ